MKLHTTSSLLVFILYLSLTTHVLGQKSYDTLYFFKDNFTPKQAEQEFTDAIDTHANVALSTAHQISFAYFQYAIDKNDSSLLKSAYYQIGLVYFQKTKYDSALFCLTLADKIATIQNDTAYLINIKRATGAVNLNTNNKLLALDNFKTSLKLAKLTSDSISMAKALNNLSLLSTQSKEYENALNYLKRALDLKIAFAPKQEQISTLINIGNNYANLESYDRGLDYLIRAKNISNTFGKRVKLAEIWLHMAHIYYKTGQNDDAEDAYHRSMDISTEINDQASLQVAIKKYAEYLMSINRWEEAETKLESILSKLNEKQNPLMLSEIYYNLGDIAYRTKNHLKAQAWLTQSINITGIRNEITLRKAYNLLSLISYVKEDYEMAYHYIRISNIISDSIAKSEDIDRLHELQVKYNSVNDKKSIEHLLEITELKDQEKQKSKFYFIVTLTLFIITFSVAIALARQVRIKHRQSSELTIQNKENLDKTKDLVEAHKLAKEGLKVKSEFIAMVSHEIRTPMNAIIGMSSLLAETELNDFQKNYLNNISISSNNLLILLNDILDFSRVEAGKVNIKLQPSNLDKELKHVVNMFQPLAQEKELEFHVKLDENIPDIAFIDAPRLRQVVINLLSNAIKFTHRGYVSLSVQVIDTEPTLNGEMFTLRFAVKDTGIGVPDNKQNEIFSSFNQLDSKVSRQYSGVGLGLSISQGILGMMGSTISLESEFATGSTFSFDLKMKGEKNKKPTHVLNGNKNVKFDKELGITCPLRILVAEDNEINQKLIQINLNKMGYNPFIVSNGQEALDQLKIQEFDVIFMDVQMPVLDGVSATKEIVRMYGKQKPIIIAVTANAMGTDKQSYIEAGMDDYISKPFTPHEINTCLRNWYVHLNG